jgi:aryl-alcohol dehydrogenase-like predicted oxidoreductase
MVSASPRSAGETFAASCHGSGGDLAGRLGELRRGLAGLAADTGLSMSALAIGWVLANGAKATVGARNPGEAAAIAGYRPLARDLAAAVGVAACAFDE